MKIAHKSKKPRTPVAQAAASTRTREQQFVDAWIADNADNKKLTPALKAFMDQFKPRKD